MAERAALSFAGLLRQLRGEARLTQEELAEAARVSPRSVSDLERGINQTARKDTALLLADALGLADPVRAVFVAAARGRAPVAEVLAVRDGAAAGGAAATRSLPRDIACFTGRAAELARLLAAATGASAAGGGVVGIHTISGMAGIGKSTLVVHAAHLLAPGFPDGQFFLPLHAHTPGQRPVEPADALASLLLAAGVDAQQIPPGAAARAARWRDWVAGKRVLLVLDDAAGHEQVTPLLPGTAGSVVLVTSRRHLTALADATVISLDILPPGEAAALLARLSARPELSSGRGAAGEITRLCGYLPLAIGMLAAQLRHHPAWTPAGLAAELAGAVDRLELMRAENLSVAAAFDLSYQELTPDQQRLFCLLGLHPGASIDAYAAAALAGTGLVTARRDLESLYDQHLLTEGTRGRYGLHDLVREHARALAAAGDPAGCAAASGRLLDYYLHAAAAAGPRIAGPAITPVRPLPGEAPALAPPLTTPGQAAAWLEAELANLCAVAGYAAASGHLQHAIAIPAAISGFLSLRGYRDLSAALNRAALAAARQAGDRAGQADALNELGALQVMAGDRHSAAASLNRALELYHSLGDQAGQASALGQLGNLQAVTGDYPAAAASLQQALRLYRGLDHRAGQATAINNLGSLQWLTGDYPAAAASHQQALGIFGDIGHRPGQAGAILSLGNVQGYTGDSASAAASFRQALAICRDLGDRNGQAAAILNLGDVQRAAGDFPAAAASQRQAIRLFRDLGNRGGQARAISNLADVQGLTGDYPAAAASYQQALGIARGIGDRQCEAEVLNNLGGLPIQSPGSRQAREHCTQALAIARDIGSPRDEARALEVIGLCYFRDGNPGDGAAHLQQALTIYQRIGSPEAGCVQEFLRGARPVPPSPSSQGRQPGPRAAP